MRKVEEVLKKSKAVPPQSKKEIVRGMHVHRTKGGIPVLSVHYSADPERDPQVHPEWKQTERRAYSSQAAWDREQEMVDEAGGGELVFADTLLTYWNKIVITTPLGGRHHTGESRADSIMAKLIPQPCYVPTSTATV